MGVTNKVLVRKKLLSIFVVSGLGSTGYSCSVFNSEKKEIGGFVVLDSSIFGLKANDWATKRASSAFTDTPSSHLTELIEESESNNVSNAVQYILLHELGHILSIGSPYVPSITDFSLAEQSVDRFSFSKLSWIPSFSGFFASKYDSIFTIRPRLRFYSNDEHRLPASQIQEILNLLEKTNFPTLYSSINPFDDFAESFANYIHIVILKKSFRNQIISHGRVMFTLQPCWNESRCAAKKIFFDRLFSSAVNDAR